MTIKELIEQLKHNNKGYKQMSKDWKEAGNAVMEEHYNGMKIANELTIHYLKELKKSEEQKEIRRFNP